MTICELIKASESKTFMLFNLFLLTILFYHVVFFLFSINDLYFLIPAITPQILNPIAELTIPLEISLNEAKEEFKHIQR